MIRNDVKLVNEYKESSKYYINIFKNSYYKIKVIQSKEIEGLIRYEFDTLDKNVPNIHIKTNINDCRIEEITVDVNGIGAVSIEETEEIIQGLQIGIETVKQLKEIFDIR